MSSIGNSILFTHGVDNILYPGVIKLDYSPGISVDNMVVLARWPRLFVHWCKSTEMVFDDEVAFEQQLDSVV